MESEQEPVGLLSQIEPCIVLIVFIEPDAIERPSVLLILFSKLKVEASIKRHSGIHIKIKY